MPRTELFFPLLLKVPGMVQAHRARVWSQTQPGPVWIRNQLKSQSWFTKLKLRPWSEPSHRLGQSEIRLLALDLSWASLGWASEWMLLFWAEMRGRFDMQTAKLCSSKHMKEKRRTAVKSALEFVCILSKDIATERAVLQHWANGPDLLGRGYRDGRNHRDWAGRRTPLDSVIPSTFLFIRLQNGCADTTAALTCHNNTQPEALSSPAPAALKWHNEMQSCQCVRDRQCLNSILQTS